MMTGRRHKLAAFFLVFPFAVQTNRCLCFTRIRKRENTAGFTDVLMDYNCARAFHVPCLHICYGPLMDLILGMAHSMPSD